MVFPQHKALENGAICILWTYLKVRVNIDSKKIYMSNLNQDERESEDTSNSETDNDSNSQNGDESILSDELTSYNESVGKNYKSWDDVANREKETDKAFANGDHKQSTGRQTESVENFKSNEIIYLNQRPEAKDVWGEVKKRAETAGVDPIQYYESDNIMQDYAKRTFDEGKKESERKSKLDAPSGFNSSSKVNLDKVKSLDGLKPSQKSDWLSKMADKENKLVD